MSTGVQQSDRIEMSQRERDALEVMPPVLRGERTQAEAAALLGLTVRQVRRLQRERESGGDAAVHGLRGKPSNRQPGREPKRAVLAACREHYPDFGPPFAAEKLAEAQGLRVGAQTLRRWLAGAGLWARQRRREARRSRRPRRRCFGELAQFGASSHDWLEGRGEALVRLSLIDDAPSRVTSRSYREGTAETHADLPGRWLRKHGRPLALYADRHSLSEPQDKGKAVTEGVARFGRALCRAGRRADRGARPAGQGAGGAGLRHGAGPLGQGAAPGRGDDGGTGQRGAGAAAAGSQPALRQGGQGQHRRAPGSGSGPRPGAILSVRPQRAASNDHAVRFGNRFYQRPPPALPGLRGGKVIVEERLDGTSKVRFGDNYPRYQEITRAVSPGGSAPRPPEFGAQAADASGGRQEVPAPGEGGPGWRTAGRRALGLHPCRALPCRRRQD